MQTQSFTIRSSWEMRKWIHCCTAQAEINGSFHNRLFKHLEKKGFLTHTHYYIIIFIYNVLKSYVHIDFYNFLRVLGGSNCGPFLGRLGLVPRPAFSLRLWYQLSKWTSPGTIPPIATSWLRCYSSWLLSWWRLRGAHQHWGLDLKMVNG